MWLWSPSPLQKKLIFLKVNLCFTDSFQGAIIKRSLYPFFFKNNYFCFSSYRLLVYSDLSFFFALRNISNSHLFTEGEETQKKRVFKKYIYIFLLFIYISLRNFLFNLKFVFSKYFLKGIFYKKGAQPV